LIVKGQLFTRFQAHVEFFRWPKLRSRLPHIPLRNHPIRFSKQAWSLWDGTEDLINALKKGEVDLVLAQKPGEIGSLAVEWGYKYLKDGAKIPDKKLVPGFFVFTKDNVNDPDSQQYIYSK